jgi:hypothetical protein
MEERAPRRRSAWILRALEWDEPRARYPNLWVEGLPRHVLAAEAMAGRLRLGDLIAIWSPASTKHPERSERFAGLVRVSGLRRADVREQAWIDVEPAHCFATPLVVPDPPRRVLLCCDPGWPEPDVTVFRRVVAAATQEGFHPLPEDAWAEAAEDREAAARPGTVSTASVASAAAASAVAEAVLAPPELEAGPAPIRPRPSPRARRFAGADYSGDMRDPRDGTWLAVVELEDARLRLRRLEAVGRAGLHSVLRDADAALPGVEAIGLDFPFGLPLGFARRLLGGSFEDGDWWTLARCFERLGRLEYLRALQDYRDAHGEEKRLTDEAAGAFSPLHRVNPDLAPMTYHGIRMIAEERSRFAVRPFESAQGRLLLEVYPGGLTRRLDLRRGALQGGRPGAILAALAALPMLPVEVESPLAAACLGKRDALDAVLAARCAAAAVLGGEADLPAARLAPEDVTRVRREGWIYGLQDPLDAEAC